LLQIVERATFKNHVQDVVFLAFTLQAS
jgi:hypothetical protein